ncbi:MAG TPA: surface-adhesin E family protein [Gallionellaceae bacterium]|nr:surface-adhesin E family protein [Gallionellaceae bacterium]
MNKTLLLLLALLLPAVASAADWLALGAIPEAHVFVDEGSLQVIGDDAVMARVKLVYNRIQPAQTISQGSPFDSSINQYYLVCSTQKYQVLELTVFYNNKQVGSFHANPDPARMDQAQLGTGIMLLARKVCPKLKPGPAHTRGG